MRSILNTLSDPSLHFLAVAMVLIYLAFGGGSWSKAPGAESPLSYCKTCNVHYLPEKSCDCFITRKIANVFH